MNVTNATVTAGAAILVSIILSCAVLTGMDKLGGDLFITGVIAPIVVAVTGYVAHSKGTQQGSQAATDPPADG